MMRTWSSSEPSFAKVSLTIDSIFAEDDIEFSVNNLVNFFIGFSLIMVTRESNLSSIGFFLKFW